MQRTKTFITEEVFLFLTFSEFVKCWRSSKRSRLVIDSVNGKAFVNFSVFLGSPGEAHSLSTPRQRNPPPKEKKQKKNLPRKSNVIMNVRQNSKQKRGRRRLQQKQRVEFHLQRLLPRQSRQSELLQSISALRPL